MATIYQEKSWWQFTLPRITLALIAGILLGKYLVVPSWLLTISFVVSVIIWVLIEQLSNLQLFRKKWIAGIALLIIFVVAGNRVYIHATDIPIQIQPTVTLLDAPIQKNNSYQARASMGESVLLIYFHKLVNIHTLKAGTSIRLFKKPVIIANTSNPGGFNFKAYAASQHIYHQVYLTQTHFEILKQHPLPFNESLLDQAKKYVLTAIEKYIHLPRERGVAEALLIGYKKNLDKDLLNAYTNTGVIHIIAISGLHLGMIYTLLLWLFKPLNHIKHLQWVKRVLILLILWGFTLLTGAGASVLRAAVMFSFLIVGEQQKRPVQILNTLAASAFCLLLYHPLFLWDIGFQLSYTAVAGIVFFAKPIEKWIYIQNKILKIGWQLCSVTLAAQLLTLPLLLYYFHSFPNLFLLTNFFAVPISGLILYLLMALLAIAPMNLLAKPIGQLAEQLLYYLNQLIENSARLPFALTEYIHVSLLQTIGLYICIIAISIWLLQQKLHQNKRAFWVGCLGLLLFIGLRAISIIQLQQQQKILVYHAPKYMAIDVMEGLGHRYIGNPPIEQERLLNNNYLKPSRTLYRAGNPLVESKAIIRFPFLIGQHKTVLMVHPKWAFPALHMIPKIDLIIVSGNPTLPLDELSRYYPQVQLVFDSSNPLWKIQLWKKEAERLHLRHHSVPEQGAFEYNL